MVTTAMRAPLIGLDAVVIDTETTGLDARKARLLEVAVVRIVGGRTEPDSAWRRLVQPGEPIPRAQPPSTASTPRSCAGRAGLCRSSGRSLPRTSATTS